MLDCLLLLHTRACFLSSKLSAVGLMTLGEAGMPAWFSDPLRRADDEWMAAGLEISVPSDTILIRSKTRNF